MYLADSIGIPIVAYHWYIHTLHSYGGPVLKGENNSDRSQQNSLSSKRGVLDMGWTHP